MKKSLIALAVASVFIAPVALAEVTVYGLASVSLDMNDTGAATNNKATKVSSSGSRLGFKGSEVLGNGLSAFFVIETGIDLDSPVPTTLGDRDAFAGLKSDSMGSVKLGNGGTPYRTSTRGLDLFDGTVAANVDTMSNGNKLDGGANNSLTYTSPNMGGVTVELAKSFDESGAATDTTGGTAIAAKYTAGAIYATIAHRTRIYAADNELSGTKVGGSYSTDAFAVNLVFENIKDTTAIDALEAKGTNIYLGAKYNLSSTGAVKLAITTIGDTERLGVTTKNGNRNIVVGYDHTLSKTTKMYALYSTTTANAAAAADPSVISFGLHKAF